LKLSKWARTNKYFNEYKQQHRLSMFALFCSELEFTRKKWKCRFHFESQVRSRKEGSTSIFYIRVCAICNAREHPSMHSRYGFTRGAPIPRTENTTRAVRTAWKVIQSRYRRVGVEYVDGGRCTVGGRSTESAMYACGTRNEKERIRIRVCAAAAARRRATASTSGEVTAVFVCRDATQRSEKKEGGKREREQDEEREKQQSKPCRATAVARVAVHNKNRRCFNVTNISRWSFFIYFRSQCCVLMGDAKAERKIMRVKTYRSTERR